MHRKKMLITGASGMLGKDVARIFLNDSDYDVYGLSRNASDILEGEKYINCDLTDSEQLKCFLNRVQPDLIVHCAANVNVDNCEENKQSCFKLNSQVTEFLASFEPHKTKFIYISTDSIFDGLKGDYNEEDKTNPLNYYAWSKLQGELLALKQNKNSIIIRTNIYGYHEPIGNSLGEWAIKSLFGKVPINGFYDVFFNPLYTRQAASVIKRMCEEPDIRGIYHCGSNRYVSKYNFLKYLCEVFGFDKGLLQKSTIDKIETKAKRPKNTTLQTSKLFTKLKLDFSLIDGLSQFNDDYKLYLEGSNEYAK